MSDRVPPVCQQDRPVGADPLAPRGYMQDHRGRFVPVASVKPEHQLMDQVVRELHLKADQAQAELARLKAAAFAEIDAYAEMLAAKYGAKLGGDRGNMTLSTYDGSLTVEVAVSDTLKFGPELQAAKVLIDQCLRRLTKTAGASLKTLVLGAFEVDKQGAIRVDRVLELRRHQIDEPDWLDAMQAIADAVQVVRSKRYVRFYRRKAVGQKAEKVALDLAGVSE